MALDLELFFAGIYGPAQAHGPNKLMCVAYLRPGGKMIQRFFPYPEGVDRATELIHSLTVDTDGQGQRGADVYYCVSLVNGHARDREHLDLVHCVWADLDTTPPTKLKVEPTFLIETSPNKYQAIWTLAEPVPYSTAEDFARRVYYAHHRDGADPCWDATRLLRVPGTRNLKYALEAEGHPMVKLVGASGTGRTLEEFNAAYPPVEEVTAGSARSTLFDPTEVSRVGTGPEVLKRYFRELDEETLNLWKEIPRPDDDWSARLWALEMACFEAGMDINEVFAVAQSSGCNKYDRDGRADNDLWKEVLRARETFERNTGLAFGAEVIESIDLLTAEEIREVQAQPAGFLERYQDWAKKRTDAPVEFHTGGALMALSVTLSDRLAIPTQFASVRPNLWVLLLADSTISRKSTSMNLAEEIYGPVAEDCLLATDGTMEGLLTELSLREGRTSVFVRDEFTGLLAGAKKKDYMSDFLAQMCALYDGKASKRRLSKTTIEVKSPIMPLFAGGVESRMLELLTHEDVTSGFVPRFIPIFGQTDVTRLTLIGPPRSDAGKTKATLIDELRTIQSTYTLPPTVFRLAGQHIGSPKEPNLVEVGLADQAWTRLQKAQRYLIAVADNHDARDLLLPCTERLVVNVLKVAALIAASRLRPVEGGQMLVQYEDMMLSLYMARSWLDNLLRVVSRVGKDPQDQLTSKVLDTILRAGEGGITKGSVMRTHRLSARDAEEVFNTLVQQERIVAVRPSKEPEDSKPKRGTLYRASHYAHTKTVRVTTPLTVRRINHTTP
jgi:hypothetical protein